MYTVLQKFNWNGCGRRVPVEGAEEAAEQVLFDGRIYKLHGDMEHE